MFTGLVEELGTVSRVERVPHGTRLAIAAGAVARGLSVGDSVAVDGVCLTAIDIDGAQVAFEVSPESLARTNLGGYAAGTEVNLERPLAAGARIGGHFVQGHVDAVTRQRYLREEGDFVRVGFATPAGLGRYLVPKGSVAVNGVSLTVAAIDDEGFDVQLVPHTLAHTNLTSTRRAAALNVEVDVLGKYVARMLAAYVEAQGAGAAGLPLGSAGELDLEALGVEPAGSDR